MLSDCVANMSSIFHYLTDKNIEKFALSSIAKIPGSNATSYENQRYETAVYMFMNAECSQCQKMTVKYILKPDNFPKNLLSDSLPLLHHTITKPTHELIDTLDNICFKKFEEINNQKKREYYEEIPEIEKRSCLALGKILSPFKHVDSKKTRRIINKFHRHLYSHRPSGKFELFFQFWDVLLISKTFRGRAGKT